MTFKVLEMFLSTVSRFEVGHSKDSDVF